MAFGASEMTEGTDMAPELIGQDDDIRKASHDPLRRSGAPLGIALGGGAARGLSHIGVLKSLTARRLFFPVITGTSMGAIVGAAYACGKLAEIEAVARSITPITMSGWLDMNLRTGALKGDAVKEVFGQFIGDTTFADLRDRGTFFAVVAADLDNEEPVYISEGRVDDAVRASMSIPGVFEPVGMDGRVLVDGGLMDNVPVDAARSLGASIVVGVEVLNTYDIWTRAALRLGLSVVQIREMRMRLRQMAAEQRALRQATSGPRDETNVSVGLSSGTRDDAVDASVGLPGGAGPDEEGAYHDFTVPANNRQTELLVGQGRNDELARWRKGLPWSRTSLKTTLDALDFIASILEDGRQPFRANSRADVFIRPDVRRYHAHQFYRAPQLIALGERAAREALPDIMALAAGQLDRWTQ